MTTGAVKTYVDSLVGRPLEGPPPEWAPSNAVGAVVGVETAFDGVRRRTTAFQTAYDGV